jgi:hypothetical protein
MVCALMIHLDAMPPPLVDVAAATASTEGQSVLRVYRLVIEGRQIIAVESPRLVAGAPLN